MKKSPLVLNKNSKLIYFFITFLICSFLVLSNLVITQESSSTDTDQDGLHDIYEDFLGSNSNYSSDVISLITLNSYYYLVDTNADNISDIFFDASVYRYNDVENIDGILYIDFNFDGKWDYTYDGDLETIEEESFDMLLIFLIIGIILFVVILVIVILFKKGIIYLYEEEYIVEE